MAETDVAKASQGMLGLVVEAVGADSAAAQAGLRVGDHLLRYDGKPLLSPAALQAGEENTFGKESVALAIVRKGAPLSLPVPPGSLGIEVRPVLPPEVLRLYERGRAAQQGEKAGTEEAVALWREAAHAAREAGDPLVAAWLHGCVGALQEGQSDWQEAQEAYMATWAVLRDAGDAAARSRVLSSLGRCSYSLSDFAAARQWHEQARQVAAEAGHGLWEAQSLNNLGNVARDRGDLASAQDYYAWSLAIQERLAPGSLEMADTLLDLGRLALEARRFPDALSLLQRATQIVEAQRQQIAATEARALLIAQHADKYAGLVRAHLALGNLADAFAALERGRARSLIELLAERRLDFHADAPAPLLQQQRELDAQRFRAYTALAQHDATADEAQIQTLQAQLRELERRQQELAAEIRQASPRFASLQYPVPLDLRGAQAALDPGTLLLSYQVDNKDTCLFAVTRDSLEVFTLPVERKALEEQVKAFRQALDVRLLGNTAQEAAAQGQRLYDLLVGPAQALVQRAKRLLLCPDGPLHALPFAALVTQTQPKLRHLGQERPLHAVVSMTVYAQTRQPAAPARKPAPTSRPAQDARPPSVRLLALGDPLYARKRPVPKRPGAAARGSVAGGETGAHADPELLRLRGRGLTLEPLPFSRDEVENIAGLFGEAATTRLGKDATKTAAKQESPDADIVHFACHGFLDHEMPLSSGLVLSQPEVLGRAAKPGDQAGRQRPVAGVGDPGAGAPQGGSGRAVLLPERARPGGARRGADRADARLPVRGRQKRSGEPVGDRRRQHGVVHAGVLPGVAPEQEQGRGAANGDAGAAPRPPVAPPVLLVRLRAGRRPQLAARPPPGRRRYPPPFDLPSRHGASSLRANPAFAPEVSTSPLLAGSTAPPFLNRGPAPNRPLGVKNFRTFLRNSNDLVP